MVSVVSIPDAKLSPIQVVEVVWDVVKNHTLRDHNTVAFKDFYRLIVVAGPGKRWLPQVGTTGVYTACCDLSSYLLLPRYAEKASKGDGRMLRFRERRSKNAGSQRVALGSIPQDLLRFPYCLFPPLCRTVHPSFQKFTTLYSIAFPPFELIFVSATI